jgi:N-acetylneuraminic acid mutarotase
MVDDDYENEIKDLTISESKKKKDDEEWEWASTVPEGVPPCARGGHSATLIGNIIVIFGGHYYSDKKIGFKYLNDTHYLNVKDSKWLKPYCTGKIPPPRYGHSSVYAGGYVIIFGGHGPKKMIYNDLYTYDPSKFVWLVANETGEAPQPRFNHTANVYSRYTVNIDKKMYIFGGWNGTEYFNDVITFDLEKMVWSKLETSGIFILI